MKLPGIFLGILLAQGFAQTTTYQNFVRQTQQGSNVVWDMQGVAATGSAPSVLLMENGGSLFQLWTILTTSDELNTLITREGTYTFAIMSETVFDTRLLCEPVTFSVKRTITVNAMHVNYSDDTER